MRRQLYRFVSIVLSVLFLISSATAQPHDWTALQRLPFGKDVWIETRQGEKLHGDLGIVRDNEIVIWSDERGSPGRQVVERLIRREDVKRVRLSHRVWSQIAGAAIGVGLGVAIGAAVDSQAKSNEDNGVVGAVLGLLMGFGGGAVGKSHPFIRGKVIYQAQ